MTYEKGKKELPFVGFLICQALLCSTHCSTAHSHLNGAS